jgi:hypothetical protein
MAKVVNGFRKSLNLCNEAWETVALLTGPSSWTHENIENCLFRPIAMEIFCKAKNGKCEPWGVLSHNMEDIPRRIA